MTAAPPLALTLGDPAGIGPEIVVKAWSALAKDGPAFMAVGDFEALASAPGARASQLRRVMSADEAAKVFPTALPVLDLPLLGPALAGHPSSTAATSVIQCTETAVCLARSGAVRCVVTSPIS